MDDAEALVALGAQCYADDDFPGARRHWEEAFRLLRGSGERRRAARVAADLAELHIDMLGNRAAGRGWLGRARRLLDGEEPCAERGHVELAIVACEWTDVDALERVAGEALALALEVGDAELEARALADSGYALVCAGRTEEGFGRLDEALAAIVAGEVRDPGVAAKSFCAMLSACDRAGDVARGEEWTRLVDELLDTAGFRPRVLHTHCRLAYGSVLCSVGRWSEGEAALLEALGPTGSVSRVHQAEAAARLAEVRVLQGRLDEAAELLAGHEDRPSACPSLAALHLARGEHDLAAAAVHRGLDAIVGDRLQEAALLALLVEIELARDVDRAASAADRLAAVAADCDTEVLAAVAGLAAGRVAAARAEPEQADGLLRDALRHLATDDRPALAGAIRFERARALAAAGDTPAAVSEAQAALAVFERLGARPDVDRTAALLRSLGARGPARPRRPADAVGGLTSREREVLELLRHGLTNAEIATRLYISPKTAEHHVGRVLTKLGVRSRAEAAAVAAVAVAGSGAG